MLLTGIHTLVMEALERAYGSLPSCGVQRSSVYAVDWALLGTNMYWKNIALSSQHRQLRQSMAAQDVAVRHSQLPAALPSNDLVLRHAIPSFLGD